MRISPNAPATPKGIKVLKGVNKNSKAASTTNLVIKLTDETLGCDKSAEKRRFEEFAQNWHAMEEPPPDVICLDLVRKLGRKILIFKMIISMLYL